MSLLTIVQDVADETQLFERPTTVIANSNKEARQSLSFIKTVCLELLRYHDWQVLTKEQLFITDGSGSYPFTSIVTDGDYERPKTNTEWDRSNNKKIQIITASNWQMLKSGLVSAVGIYRWARGRGGNLIMTPDNAGDELVFEYISNFYAKSSLGVAQATFTNDNDTSFFQEDLIKAGLKFYLKSEYGLPAEEDSARYYDMMETLAGDEKPMPVIKPMDRYFQSRYIVNIPDTGAGL